MLKILDIGKHVVESAPKNKNSGALSFTNIDAEWS